MVLVVTDGEPTAHLEDDGTPFFCWPPMPETIAATVAEVERVARTRRDGQRLRARRRPAPGALRARPHRAGRRAGLPARPRAARRVRRRRLPARPPRPPRPLTGTLGTGTVTAEPTDRDRRGLRRGDHLSAVAATSSARGGRSRGSTDPAGTFHLAARTADGQLVGVVRFSPAPCPWRTAAAPWQLRGMATDPAVRGTGAGRALVAEGLARVAALGGDLVWCDARVRRRRVLRADGFRRGHRAVRQARGRPAPGHGGSSPSVPGDVCSVGVCTESHLRGGRRRR